MSEIIIKEKDKQKNFILSGNLWKVMFDLSWPAVIAMVPLMSFIFMAMLKT